MRIIRDFNAIRGKEPTKTDMILEYLVNHPNKVLSPKEIAEGLNFNLQTTITILNRLSLEGAISKKGRGKFSFEADSATGREMEAKAAKPSGKKAQTPKIDNKTAEAIYSAIYEMAMESTSSKVLNSLIGIGPDDFDDKAPIDSIKNLIRSLMDVMGEEIADDIVSVVLESERIGKDTEELKQLLEA